MSEISESPAQSAGEPQNNPSRPHFLELSQQQWESFVQAAGQPKYRTAQVTRWVYEHFASHPDQMTNLPGKLRQALTHWIDWRMPEVLETVQGEDNSTKMLLASHKGHRIETVLMRYDKRTSVCVSSQVGCRLACRFCQTGKLGFFRHLSAAEILAQYFLAARIVRQEALEQNSKRRLSHLVFMGMGEPLDNYQAVVQACRHLTGGNGEDQSLGFALNPRHVTVSTSGIAPKISSLAEDARVSLAISLHAARDELRTELMPINRRYDLDTLKASLLDYQQKTGQKLTMEYIMIKDKNCGRREVKDLVRFLHGLRAKVNLIPFNDHPGLPYERPEEEEIRSFQKYLSERSIPAPVRYSKGLDVSAACGQLAAKTAPDLQKTPERARVMG